MRYLLILMVVATSLPAQGDPASTAERLRVGDDAPMPDAELVFASFKHLDECRGKAFVFVYFVTENGRSLVRPLNALHDKYHEEGLVVCAVTHRSEEQVEAFVKRNRPRFAVIYEPSNLSMGSYPFTFWPAAAIVDPRGKIAWKGSGSGIPVATIKKVLKTARLVGPNAPLRIIARLPKSLKSASKALETAKLDVALKLLGKARGDDREFAKETIKEIETLLRDKLEAAQKAEAGEDWYRAHLIHSRLVKHAPKSGQGRKAAVALKRMGTDRRIKLEVEAGAALKDARAAMNRRDWKLAKKLLEPLVKRKYEGTKAAEKAQRLLNSMK